MKTYWALVYFLTKPLDEKGHCLETSLPIEFKAEGWKKAVQDAVRFARNRERNLKGWKFVCLKLGEFDPSPIEPDGSFVPSRRANFFEWKYDWPGTLEERIESDLKIQGGTV